MVKNARQMIHSVQRTTYGTGGDTPSFLSTDTSCAERAGFTLIELLVVLVVIGILAVIALPRYGATLERSRQAEATSILGAMRGAQLRYAAENNGAYAATITALDIELPDNDGLGTPGDGKFFDYTVINSGGNIARATRNNNQLTAGNSGYQLQININGTISCVVPKTCAGTP